MTPQTNDDSHPFRFYGRHPSDWNAFDPFEIRFADVPSDEKKEELGATFVRESRKLGLEPESFGDWSGRFLLISFASPSGAGMAKFLDKTETLLRRLHAVSPIDQVVFWGTRAPSEGDALTRWSLGQSPPVPGPDNGMRAVREFAFSKECDPALPPYATDDAFLRGCSSEREKHALEALKSPPKSASGKESVVLVEAQDAPPPSRMTREQTEKAFGFDRVWPNISASGRVAVLRDRGQREIYFLDDDGRVRQADIRGPSVSIKDMRDDGTALLCLNGGAIIEVAMPSGQPVTVFELPREDRHFRGVAYGQENRVVFATNRRLVLLEREGLAAREATVIDDESLHGVFHTHGGRILVVSRLSKSARATPTAWIVGTRGNEMKRIATVKADIQWVWASPGKVFVRLADAPDKTFELQGLEGAYRAVFGAGGARDDPS